MVVVVVGVTVFASVEGVVDAEVAGVVSVAVVETESKSGVFSPTREEEEEEIIVVCCFLFLVSCCSRSSIAISLYCNALYSLTRHGMEGFCFIRCFTFFRLIQFVDYYLFMIFCLTFHPRCLLFICFEN